MAPATRRSNRTRKTTAAEPQAKPAGEPAAAPASKKRKETADVEKPIARPPGKNRSFKPLSHPGDAERKAKRAKKEAKQQEKAAKQNEKATQHDDSQATKNDNDKDDGPSYWLMKAEPESRIEKGVDVKFSIDDLAAAKEPEGWDGVRNMVARNNMRAMKKGELAFFYHSNCKVPGIVGIMEIVKEHSVDTTPEQFELISRAAVNAQDPKHPYYDPKASPENPRWSLVHVEFRRKFPDIISLKELQKYKGPGGELENLQTLKLSRLSVSKVSKREWDFILSLVEDK